MILTSLTILAVTYFSSRHYRKKALNNLSETGKEKETQLVRRPKVFLGKESFTKKGLKYRTIVWAIVLVGLILAVVVYFIHF
jgi:hypothetical protein